MCLCVINILLLVTRQQYHHTLRYTPYNSARGRGTSSGCGLKLALHKSGSIPVVYCDGSCYGNGRTGARAGIGIYWEEDSKWYKYTLLLLLLLLLLLIYTM